MKFKNKLVWAFTLVEIMVTVSIVALLAVIAIPQLLRARMVANESNAKATLKTISTALETYAAESAQGYPTDISVLATIKPPYLNQNYIADSPIQGYNYTCDSLGVSSYICSAEPQSCGWTGSKIYTITTGGVFAEADCN